MDDLEEPKFNVHESRKNYMIRKEYEKRKEICNKLNKKEATNLILGIIIAIFSLFFIKISLTISIILFILGVSLIYISRKQKKEFNIEYSKLRNEFIVKYGTVYVRKHQKFRHKRKFRRRFRR